MKQALQCLLGAFVLLALILPSSGLAQIYKTVDKDGNVSYSDTPPEPQQSNTSELILDPINTTPALKKPQEQPAQAKAKSDAAAINYTLTITSPRDQASLTAGQRDLHIRTALNHKMPAGGQIVINLDGQNLNAGQDGSLVIHNIHRGEHRIYAQLMQGQQLLAKSEAVTIYVFRPGVN